jgi:hypothetical protein
MVWFLTTLVVDAILALIGSESKPSKTRAQLLAERRDFYIRNGQTWHG